MALSLDSGTAFFKLGREFYLDEEMDSDGDPITSHLPGLEQD